MTDIDKARRIANQIERSLRFATEAHTEHPLRDKNAVRLWDGSTPYIVHPAWCAMTILCEPTLDETIRLNGFMALMWHDVLEDTCITSLPKDTSPDIVEYIVEYVEQMTFKNFDEELSSVWTRPADIRLLKLYDKTSNLLDGTWMNDEKWNQYTEFTRTLAADVEQNFGLLNIVKIARSIAIPRTDNILT